MRLWDIRATKPTIWLSSGFASGHPKYLLRPWEFSQSKPGWHIIGITAISKRCIGKGKNCLWEFVCYPTPLKVQANCCQALATGRHCFHCLPSCVVHTDCTEGKKDVDSQYTLADAFYLCTLRNTATQFHCCNCWLTPRNVGVIFAEY